jgi:formylglycine-generating enzyme required for sulfatase activity
VLVPAGEFVMGDGTSGQNDERPAHPVSLDAFYIDQCAYYFDSG